MKSAKRNGQYAAGYADATKDVAHWLDEKLGDWEQARNALKSHAGFLVGIVACLHGAKKDIQRGAARGARARARAAA